MLAVYVCKLVTLIRIILYNFSKFQFFIQTKNATENLKLEHEAKAPNKTVKRDRVEGANSGKELQCFATAV